MSKKHYTPLYDAIFRDPVACLVHIVVTKNQQIIPPKMGRQLTATSATISQQHFFRPIL